MTIPVRTAVVACAALLLGEWSMGQAMSDWNVRDHTPADKVVMQSHRGAGVLAPENTLEAFEMGWRLGTVPECDLRTTKDGVIVTFHDDNFSRVVVGASEELQKKKVPDLTWEELSKLDVGEGRHVIPVAKALEAMKGKPQRRLYMDIKNIKLPQLAELVKQHGVEKQVILAAPKYETIREWKALVPESDTLWWMRRTEAEVEAKLAQLRKNDYKDATQVQIHTHLKTKGATDLTSDPFEISDAFLIKATKELHEHGILVQTLPYDTTDKQVYWKLMDLGFESFATDYPDMTAEAIREYYGQKK